MAGNCWPHYVGGGFKEAQGGGGAGNVLQLLYREAVYAQFAHERNDGVAPTLAQRHMLRVASPLPRSVMGPGPQPS